MYILDWGVAKSLEDTGSSAEIVELAPHSETATLSCTAMGTPGYMAPEQVDAKVPIHARADVCALGCILFEILAGVPLHPRGRAGMDSAVRGADARVSVRALDREFAPELEALCVQASCRRSRWLL